MTLQFNALVPPFDIAGGAGKIGTPEGWFDVTTVAGVDSSGATDSTTGLINGIKEAYEKQVTAYIPSGKYKIGEGGTGLTLGTSLAPNGTGAEEGFIKGLSIWSDSDVIFEGNSALKKNGVVDMVPNPAAPSGIFITPYIRFGSIKTASTEGPCLKVGAIESGEINVPGTIESGEVGLWIVSVEGNKFTSNSVYNIGRIDSSKKGLVLESPAEGTGIGVQGNTFNINIIQLCTETSITVDTAAKKNSRWNTFNLGVIGQNGGEFAIFSRANFSRFNIGIITGSAVKDLFCAGTTFFRGYAEGASTGTVVESGVTADIWNSSVLPFAPVAPTEVQPQAFMTEPFIVTAAGTKLNKNLIAATAGGAEVKGKGAITNGQKNVKELPESVVMQLEVNMEVSGTGIKAGTKIETIKGPAEITQLTLTANAEKTETTELTFKPVTAAKYSYTLPAASGHMLATTHNVNCRLRGAVRTPIGKTFGTGETLATLLEVTQVPLEPVGYEVSIAHLELKAKAKETASSKILKEVPKAIQEKLVAGMIVSGTGIPASTTIKELKGATEEIELNNEATKTENQELTFSPASFTTTRASVSTTGVITLPRYVTVAENEVIFLDGQLVLS